MEPFASARDTLPLPHVVRETEMLPNLKKSSNAPASFSATPQLGDNAVCSPTASAGGWATSQRGSSDMLASKAAVAVCARTPADVQLHEGQEEEKDDSTAPRDAQRNSSTSNMCFPSTNTDNWDRCGNNTVSERLKIPVQSSSSRCEWHTGNGETVHSTSGSGSSRDRSGSSSRMWGTFQTLEMVCELKRASAGGSSASVSTTCSRDRNRGGGRSGGGFPCPRGRSVPKRSPFLSSRRRDWCGSADWRSGPAGASDSRNSSVCIGFGHSSNSVSRTSVTGQRSNSDTESFGTHAIGKTSVGGEPAFFYNTSSCLDDEPSNNDRRKRHSTWAALRTRSSSSHWESNTTTRVPDRCSNPLSSSICVTVSPAPFGSPRSNSSSSSKEGSESDSNFRRTEGPLSSSSSSAWRGRRRECCDIKDEETLSSSSFAPQFLTRQKVEFSVPARTGEADSTAEDATAAGGRAAAGATAALADTAVAEAGAGARAVAHPAPVVEQRERGFEAVAKGVEGTGTGGGSAAGSSDAVVHGVGVCPRSSLSVFSLTCPLAFTHAVTESLLALATRQRLPVLWTAEALLQNFVDKYETFIFDVDGVLLMGKRALAGVPEGLAVLREKKKRLLFLTNSAAKSRRMCVEGLRNAGIHAEFHEVVCSSYAVALHLQLRYPHVRKVFMIGEAGLEEELRAAGFEVVHAADAAAHRFQGKPKPAAGSVDSLPAAPGEALCPGSGTKKDENVSRGAADSCDTAQGAARSRSPENVCGSSSASGAGVSATSYAAASAAVVSTACLCETHEAARGLSEEEHLLARSGADPDAADSPADGCVSHCPAIHACVAALPASENASSSLSSASAPRSPSETHAVCIGGRSSEAFFLRSVDGKNVAEGASSSPRNVSCGVAHLSSAALTSCSELVDDSSARSAPPLPSFIRGTPAVAVLPASYPLRCSSVSSARCLPVVPPASVFLAPPSSAASAASGPPSAASRAPSSASASTPPCSLPPSNSSADATPLAPCSPCVEDEEVFLSLACSLDPEVDAVVVGWDRRLDYFKLVVASLYLQQRNGTLPFLAANRDAFDIVGGWRMPANGATVAAVETAAGRTACCVGKPSAWLAETLLRLRAIKATTTVVCGDRLDTDIAFGKHAGTHTCITLTGCTTAQQLLQMSLSHPLRPDAVCPHVGLLRLLKAPRPEQHDSRVGR